MTKARSPNYPAIGLKEAIDRVALVYAKDHLNRVPKAVMASHMGYKSLSGASLPVLAALNQYGLLDGRGDETRVSDAALRILVHEPGSSTERLYALRESAARPDLFAELHKKFPARTASDAAIRAHLLLSKFLPSAADTAIRSYRETRELVDAEEEAYRRANPEQAFQVDMAQAMQDAADEGWLSTRPARNAPLDTRVKDDNAVALRKEVIALDEGDVVITFPDNLSAESFDDLKAYLDLFIRKMQRRAQKGTICD